MFRNDNRLLSRWEVLQIEEVILHTCIATRSHQQSCSFILFWTISCIPGSSTDFIRNNQWNTVVWRWFHSNVYFFNTFSCTYASLAVSVRRVLVLEFSVACPLAFATGLQFYNFERLQARLSWWLAEGVRYHEHVRRFVNDFTVKDVGYTGKQVYANVISSHFS